MWTGYFVLSMRIFYMEWFRPSQHTNCHNSSGKICINLWYFHQFIQETQLQCVNNTLYMLLYAVCTLVVRIILGNFSVKPVQLWPFCLRCQFLTLLLFTSCILQLGLVRNQAPGRSFLTQVLLSGKIFYLSSHTDCTHQIRNCMLQSICVL